MQIGVTYTSGSLLHQRKVLGVDGDTVTYRVVSSHAAAVIGAVFEMPRKQFEQWAKEPVLTFAS